MFLGECENKLKDYYNIDSNNSLLILKIDYIIPELFIPIVEYKVFNPETNESSELNNYNESPITLLYPVKKDIENDTYIHDPNNEYYKDRCIPVTTENDTDITPNDRKNEHNNNYSDKNLNISHLNKIFANEIIDVRKQIKKYTDNEINTLKYKDALIIDNRTFFQYYISLLKTKYILIFSFYNPRSIKIVFIFIFIFNIIFCNFAIFSRFDNA